MPRQKTALDVVQAYHRRTKHRLDRYAAGPEFLDWEHQPDPFRRFAGCDLLPLPLAVEVGTATLAAPRPDPAPLHLKNIAQLLELALGLSAWKVFGPDRWALRCNPSSGNLHPTEGYVAARGVAGLDDGLYHYRPDEHTLERRCLWNQGADEAGLLLGLSSITWREAWKYGERAFRYVQLDIGHALGAVGFAAATLGWRVRIIPASDDNIATLLGLNREGDFAGGEREWPDLLLEVGSDVGDATVAPWLKRAKGGIWQGRANPLGGIPHPVWPVIDEVAQASHEETAWPHNMGAIPSAAPLPTPESPLLAPLIRQRRSAQRFDPKQTLGAPSFYALLRATLPTSTPLPWDLWPLPPRLDLILFVHRIEGIEPGLYLLRRSGNLDLAAALNPDWRGEEVAGCPKDLPLLRLIAADSRQAVRTLSCHQEIASASALSLGMLAPLEATLNQEGAPGYRHLYWEAGVIGQVLYLHAEAQGVRGTGIGCFFDDPLHDLLGLEGHRFQSLYHFTVGLPKTDPRLQSEPPYAHLDAGRVEALMAGLKGRIAQVFARRDEVKGAMERGDIKPREGLATLERIDRELSDLDVRFKVMWDTQNREGSAGSDGAR